MHRNDVLRMVSRRTKDAGLSDLARRRTFRATGITLFMNGGGKLEAGQKIAGHASPRTTAVYDHSDDEVSLDEIE